MIIRAQQIIFDLVLFVYGLAAILFMARIVWVTKKNIKEAFQFILIAVILWTTVKLLAILSGLKIISVYAVSLGELFFITMLIIGTWYLKHTLVNSKKQAKRKRKTKRK